MILRTTLALTTWSTPGRLRLLAIAAVVIGLGRIIATHLVFSPTFDEAAHLATGMELLSEGRYRYEPQHPPLSRIAAAVLPYMKGLRTIGLESFWTEGHTLIHATDGMHYSKVMQLSRLGMLPFFLLACYTTWLWSRRVAGEVGGLIGVLLISASPVILGHAGLAATDLAATATFGLALYALASFLSVPSPSNSVRMGAAAALALLSKLTAILFLPAAGAMLLTCWIFSTPPQERTRKLREITRLRLLWPSLLAMALVVWAGYGFSLGSVLDPADRPYELIDAKLGSGPLARIAYTLLEIKAVPAVEVLHGVRQVIGHSDFGHRSYFLGEVRSDGWPMFFPVAVLVKNPVPFLILVVLGGIALLRASHLETRRVWGSAALLASLVIVLVSMPARINIGFRHVMPILPMLAAVAALGLLESWRAATLRPGLRVLLIGMLASFLVSSVRVHPDYITYFNFAAGKHPDRVLPFSDLDWGQDVIRLSDEVRLHAVDTLYIGTGVDIPHHFLQESMGLPPLKVLPPLEAVTGWVAVDIYTLRMGSMFDLTIPIHAYNWVEQFEPVARVGKTFSLYYFPPDSVDAVERAIIKHRELHGS